MKAYSCTICGNVPIETDGMCASCRARIRREERQAQKDSLKKIPRLQKFSTKKANKILPYAVSRRIYLKENPVCEALVNYPGSPSEEIHHCSPSELDYLEVSTWKAVCKECHFFIEQVMTAKERRAKKLLIDPVNKKFSEPHKI